MVRKKGSGNICFIGIDPAFRKGGFAVCIIDEDKEVDFKMFASFLLFLDWIVAAPDIVFCCIENSNLQDVTFNMRGNKAVIARMSRNVGKNQAASQYTVDACVKFFGKDSVYDISPKQKGGKLNADAVLLRAKANNHLMLKKRLNQDERDSYQLAVIGMNRYNLLTKIK